jgi:uncharacterized protein
VLMPLLRFVIGLPPAEAAGTCVLAVFFTTLGGGYRHYRLGHVPLGGAWPIMVAGLLATAGFSVLFPFVARYDHWLDLGIGLVMGLAALRMLAEGIIELFGLRTPGASRDDLHGPAWIKILIGALGGALPGLFGIGTGTVLVPGLRYLLGAGIRTAVGTSLVCFCGNALVSSSFKLAGGFVNLSVAIPACIGTVLGANAGALLNRRVPVPAVKTLFAVLFTYVAVRFVALSFGVPG